MLAKNQELTIGFATLAPQKTKYLSNRDVPPYNLGVAGGEIATLDNNTTGRFFKQQFNFVSLVAPSVDNLVASVNKWVAAGRQHIVLAVPQQTLLAISDAYKDKPVLFYNALALDDALRSEECRANVVHTAPSYSMLSDALAQFLVKKRWQRWFVVVGQDAKDKKMATAFSHSARKFGGKIVRTKTWDFGPDSRRTAQKEVPVFTQDVDYDMLLVADVQGLFGEYLMYRTWKPLLVAGTQGLVPTTWHSAHEQWGAVQLQNRFLETYKRRMSPLDYQVWLAVRMVGEAAVRNQSMAFDPIASRIIGEKEFSIAAFKGQKLTVRSWNNQVRQPILLASARSLVSVSPQPGFLDQHSHLDTLGISRQQSKCHFKK